MIRNEPEMLDKKTNSALDSHEKGIMLENMVR